MPVAMRGAFPSCAKRSMTHPTTQLSFIPCWLTATCTCSHRDYKKLSTTTAVTLRRQDFPIASATLGDSLRGEFFSAKKTPPRQKPPLAKSLPHHSFIQKR